MPDVRRCTYAVNTEIGSFNQYNLFLNYNFKPFVFDIGWAG